MDPQMIGTWKLSNGDSCNFDKYMTKLGVDLLTRKTACALSPNLNICQDGDTITIKTQSPFKNYGITFKLDEEFDESTADGRKCKTTVTLINGVLTQVQKWKGKETTISREVKDGQLIVTCIMEDVQCARVYSKQ